MSRGSTAAPLGSVFAVTGLPNRLGDVAGPDRGGHLREAGRGDLDVDRWSADHVPRPGTADDQAGRRRLRARPRTGGGREANRSPGLGGRSRSTPALVGPDLGQSERSPPLGLLDVQPHLRGDPRHETENRRTGGVRQHRAEGQPRTVTEGEGQLTHASGGTGGPDDDDAGQLPGLGPVELHPGSLGLLGRPALAETLRVRGCRSVVQRPGIRRSGFGTLAHHGRSGHVAIRHVVEDDIGWLGIGDRQDLGQRHVRGARIHGGDAEPHPIHHARAEDDLGHPRSR